MKFDGCFIILTVTIALNFVLLLLCCHYLVDVSAMLLACNFTKSNTPPWVFFTFLK